MIRELVRCAMETVAVERRVMARKGKTGLIVFESIVKIVKKCEVNRDSDLEREREIERERGERSVRLFPFGLPPSPTRVFQRVSATGGYKYAGDGEQHTKRSEIRTHG